MEPSNICEHCGMPMYHLTDFGTNQDGSINTEYCHKCYQKGKFIHPREENLDQERVI
ncbi:hypothetical protein Murru_0454 [Allomuricauda ruestringensis DSM 13258]|uniref:Putative zinc ribbon domain-containing protein n=1 Tax=Allomuricauda ruestringensis (strain DSM 13258 / CIP 107369 / LMG 19739 / B1) TaxID=886377 RepID=G2PRQ9_ALLRU|nr:zinc ribbon domain-containing protein [Allomuricauda ruestringensis]AEM69508.1 hypothetical protein Murru_0454 [Allomuricauda ruestringensis DSM 13258]